MCGLAGVVKKEGDAFPVLRDAIRRLEYRGYDSWGVLTVDELGAHLDKGLGSPCAEAALANFLPGPIGIAHTRWATHGKVCKENAHPVWGGRNPEWFTGDTVAVVHNGVIDNYSSLRSELEAEGYAFVTETDTEALAHLLARLLARGGLLSEMFRQVRARCRGRYSAVAIWAGCADNLWLIQNGLPLVVCEFLGMVASDAAAFSGVATPSHELLALAPGQSGVLQHGHLTLFGDGHVRVSAPPPPLSFPEKKKPGQFMREEIEEQPALVRRLAEGACNLVLSDDFRIFGCGSSYHAALLGCFFFRELGQCVANAYLPGDVPTAYDSAAAYLAISQSGETADVLGAKPVVSRDAHVLTNRPFSTLARAAVNRWVRGMDCGEERAVAATKSFTATCVRLYQFACDQTATPVEGLTALADALEHLLRVDFAPAIKATISSPNLFVGGKSYLHPIALEGALKLKECALCWAEGIHLSELKHGPLALLDSSALLLALVQDASEFTQVREAQARGCPVFCFCAAGLDFPADVPHLTLPTADVNPLLSPLVFAVALQILALEVGLKKGVDPDRPPSLAKSVTVQ